jgi:hypothetical protein
MPLVDIKKILPIIGTTGPAQATIKFEEKNIFVQFFVSKFHFQSHGLKLISNYEFTFFIYQNATFKQNLYYISTG